MLKVTTKESNAELNAAPVLHAAHAHALEEPMLVLQVANLLNLL